MEKNRIGSKEFLFTLFDIFLNGFNWLSHFYLAFIFTPRIYGQFSANLAIVSIFMISGIAVQTLLAKKISQPDNSSVQIEIIILAYLLPVIFLITFNFIPVIQNRLGLSDFLPILLIYSMHFITSLQRGVYQGQSMLFRLNLSFYLEVGTRLLLLIFVLPKIPEMNTALIIFAIGYLVPLLLGKWFKLLKTLISKRINVNFKKELITWSGAAVTQLVLLGFCSIDMIVVNSRFPEISGSFSLAQKLALVQIFFAGSFITAIFPKLTNKKGKSGAKQFLFILFTIILFLFIYEVIISITGLNVLPKSLRKDYFIQKSLLVILLISYGLMSVTNYLCHIHLAHGLSSKIFILIPAIIVHIIQSFIVSNLEIIIIVESIIFIFLCIYFLKSIKKEKCYD